MVRGGTAVLDRVPVARQPRLEGVVRRIHFNLHAMQVLKPSLYVDQARESLSGFRLPAEQNKPPTKQAYFRVWERRHATCMKVIS